MPTKKFPGLPDHIRPGVRILFVGINPGLRSAEVGHHYAGHTNRFWKLLSEAKLVPIPLTYRDDGRLPEWGYGLTNIIDRPTAGTHELTTTDYTHGRKNLLKKIQRFRPQLLVLLGLRVRDTVFQDKISGKTKANDSSRLGLQDQSFGGARVFVLPNPSGRNAYYSFQDMLKLFRQLRRLKKNMPPSTILPDAVSRKTRG